MENLKRALSFGGILNEEELDTIVTCVTALTLKPGEHFFKAGELSERLAFVDEGIFRVYIANDELDEATKYFIRKNQFMMDVESFYNRSPTEAGIQAVTQARLLVIDRTAWQQISEEIPKLFILTKTLTEAAFLNKIKDSDYLRFGTAKQRYLEFIKRYPDLSLSVPQQYIASYLQITPQSLSRIRKDALR